MFWIILRLLGLLLACGFLFYMFILWARDEDKKVQVKEALHEIELTIDLAKAAKFDTRSLQRAKEKLKETLKMGVRK